jgi:hypothetical protein
MRPKSDRRAPKVLALVADGRSYRPIARELDLSKTQSLRSSNGTERHQPRAEAPIVPDLVPAYSAILPVLWRHPKSMHRRSVLERGRRGSLVDFSRPHALAMVKPTPNIAGSCLNVNY